MTVKLGDLFRQNPKTKIIWAHAGLGRIVRPVKEQLAIMDRALGDPSLSHVYIDISWDETAKYITASPEMGARSNDALPRCVFGGVAFPVLAIPWYWKTPFLTAHSFYLVCLAGLTLSSGAWLARASDFLSAGDRRDQLTARTQKKVKDSISDSTIVEISPLHS